MKFRRIHANEIPISPTYSFGHNHWSIMTAIHLLHHLQHELILLLLHLLHELGPWNIRTAIRCIHLWRSCGGSTTSPASVRHVPGGYQNGIKLIRLNTVVITQQNSWEHNTSWTERNTYNISWLGRGYDLL